MPLVAPRGRLQDNDNLILTPAKLRLHSLVFGSYVTSVWLPHAIFAGLLLWKASVISCPVQHPHAGTQELTVSACADWPWHLNSMVDTFLAAMDRSRMPPGSGVMGTSQPGEQVGLVCLCLCAVSWSMQHTRLCKSSNSIGSWGSCVSAK